LIIVYSLLVFTWQGVVSLLPLFLQNVHDFSSGLSSAVFALLFIAGILIKPLAGRLSDVLPHLVVATSALIVASAGVGLILASPVVVGVIAGVFVYAAGHKGFAPVVQAYFIDIFPNKNKAGDLGAARIVYLLVGSLGPTYVGFASTVWGYRRAFAGFIIVLIVASLVLLAVLLSESR
jgi:Major Facilitator Superfamily.